MIDGKFVLISVKGTLNRNKASKRFRACNKRSNMEITRHGDMAT
ncbi:unnamed protein product [Rhodiola kirilowii]